MPSARFMGGREYEIVTEGRPVAWTEDDVDAVLQNGIFLPPLVQDGAAGFPHRKAMWLGGEPTPARRHVAVSFYLALMTAVCQDLINATGETIVEGPFAANDLYVKMLASATGRIVRTGSSSGTGTSIGAALLAAPAPVSFADDDSMPTWPNSRWALYAERWMRAKSPPAGNHSFLYPEWGKGGGDAAGEGMRNACREADGEVTWLKQT